MNFEVFELVIVSVVPTLLGFFAGSYKRDKHNESLYIKNLNEGLASYRKIVDEIEQKYDAQIEKMSQRLLEYEQEIETLRGRIKELELELEQR